MKELLPLEAYESPEQTPTARTALVVSVLWGVPMTSYLVYARGSMSLVAAIGIGAAGAVLFGAGWALWMRTGLLKMIRRLYAGDPSLVPPAPKGGFDARLAASLMEGRIAVGGHLYVGPRALRFVPHTKNPKAHRAPTDLQLSTTAIVQVVERQPNAFQRLFRPGPIHLLRVGDDTRTLTVLVPAAEDAAAAIQRCFG